jgi:hypothetical protein
LPAIDAISTVKNHFISNERVVVKIKTGIVTWLIGEPYNGMFGSGVDPGFGHWFL